ncbi:GTP cyclohydrolase [Paenibacillus zeisoli]|uniref:GTP cyclohydrolase n=1 Tax=Paenibacillus zeisoli TaxID=2496267 RepID=A0A3S1B9M2_9BACL|nr:YciI family protein [Paenibacillus zeisoli]RUT33422.1 GTP cyclohydrolase [Paenibacillus zeisoli]
MFIISLHYLQPLEVVDQYIEEHVQFLNKQYEEKRFIFSGRKVPRTGGVILAKTSSKEEVEELIQKDPFYQHKIAEYEIIEFQITKCDERFGDFMDN